MEKLEFDRYWYEDAVFSLGHNTNGWTALRKNRWDSRKRSKQDQNARIPNIGPDTSLLALDNASVQCNMYCRERCSFQGIEILDKCRVRVQVRPRWVPGPFVHDKELHENHTEGQNLMTYHPTITSFGLTLRCNSYIVLWYSVSTATCSSVSLCRTANAVLISTSLSVLRPNSVPITRSCWSVRRR